MGKGGAEGENVEGLWVMSRTEGERVTFLP